MSKNTGKQDVFNALNNTTELALFNIVANMPGHVYWKDVNGVYLGCNDRQAKSLGFESADSVIGKTDFDLPWAAGVAKKFRANDLDVMQTGQPRAVEEPSQMEGREVIVLSQKAPLKDRHGHVLGVLGISFDITERKKMEKELRIAKEKAEVASLAKTEFIANMGHDIRTPLTGIIGFSRFLEDEIQDPEEKDCAKQIYQSGEQLLGLLDGVLDLITADSTNEEHVEHQPFDVQRVIQDVLELERPAVKANHLDIKMHYDPNIPKYLVGDRMKLHRILLNLTGNAIKFTNEGYIELGAQLLEHNNEMATLEFSVKDTGIGIPKELQEKVFERFFKVSPSYKGIYSGNGIGLHIAQKYVDLLHGKIRLTSEVGVGTTFSFVLSLPIGQTPKEKEDFSVKDAPIHYSSLPHRKPLQVLLVEDNVSALNVLKMMAQKFDVQVSTAIDAELAFDLVEKQAFDLIITDLGLPGKQGDELTVSIREFEKQHNRTPSKIVGLSGHALSDVTKKCLDAGMDGIYRKPMMPETLHVLLEPLTSRKQEPEAKIITHGLGVDLPNSEVELFQIENHPLLDLNIAISLLGSEEVARDIFKSLQTEGVNDELVAIKLAHEQGDWGKVEKLAHKMKGGAAFGTVRMLYALLYLERYIKAGHTSCSEALYQQMLKVVDDTMTYLEEWLK